MTEKITEKKSNYDHLEKMSVNELLTAINREDQSVPITISQSINKIEEAVIVITEKMAAGGRLFYLGAGTSGRLGIVDASELPPTYGLEQGRVIGLIAGGDSAIRKAGEFAEDDRTQGWKDLQAFAVSNKDVIFGIAASGTTPYVIGALEEGRKNGITTIALTCNTQTSLSRQADIALEIVVGPEFVTGSTRMKAGTAQKLVLNMISTAVMIRLGRVKGNRMVDMQLTNNKLVDRGTKMVMDELKISETEAAALLQLHGNVRKAVEAAKENK